MALGKGLESLIPHKKGEGGGEKTTNTQRKNNSPLGRSPLVDNNQTIKPTNSDSNKTGGERENIFYIEVGKIEPNPLQPRRDFNEEGLKTLANSIQEHGILQPLVVSKKEIKKEHGRGVVYHIVAGERRWRAAKLAGFNQVPVIVRKTKDRDKLELALIENVQRSDLNSIEEARAYQKLADDFSLTQDQISKRVSKSREVVANKLRLLNLPYEIQKMVSNGSMSESHAKVLLSLSNPEKQIYLAKQTTQKNLSVRVLEDMIRKSTSLKEKRHSPKKMLDPELVEYKKNIQETIGSAVSISGSREKGRLAINFYSPEELERIIKKLTE